MTLFTEKGTFTKETSNVDGTDQTVTLSNSSLTPKVLWLWTEGGTANATFIEGIKISYGYSDGTNDACIAASIDDNVGTSDTAGTIRNDSVICILNRGTPTTIDAQADVVSFNAGNFVLNWAVSDASATIIHYMVAGGTDITNAKVTHHTTGTVATGNQAYTGVGFQGDFANFLISSDAVTAFNGANIDWNVSIGAATSSSARWFFGGHSEHNQPTTDSYTYKEINRCLGQWLDTLGTTSSLADFVSFDTSGFTLNWTDAPAATNLSFTSLVIKGGLWDVGNGTAPASTGQQTINITSGRDPAAVMFFTWGDTVTSSAGTGEAQNRISIGGADNSLNEGSIASHDIDGDNSMQSATISVNTKMIRAITANATVSISTTIAEADIIDMDNSGNFIIDWTTTLNGMGYVWFTVSEVFSGAATVSQTNIHKYNMIGNTLQSNIQKYHILNNIVQTNIQKYNLLNNVLQNSIHKYHLFAYALQSSIQKYNLFKNVLQTIIHKYDMLNFVPPATSVHKYNLAQNILQNSIQKYNLLQNILQSSIHKYSMSGLIAALSTHKYNLSAYIAAANIHKYNLLKNVLQSSIHKYDILSLAAVLATSIHKYNLLEYVSRASIHKYNLIAYILQNSIHKYNLLNIALQSSIGKYNLLVNVLQSNIHKYNLLKNVLQNSIHKYSMLQNILQGSIHKYNLLQNILQSSIHKYDIIVLGAVINTSIQKYNLLANIVQTNIHKYHLLNFISQTNIHKYSLLQNILQSSIQKYNLLVTAIQTSIHKYGLLQNVIQNSIHKYDILTQILTVLQDSIHKYHIFKIVSETSTHKYGLLQNIARNSIQKYNLLKNVLESSIHKYKMGGLVAQTSIHKYRMGLVEFLSTFTGGAKKRKAYIPRLKQIKYPVYHVSEDELFRRRKKLRETISPVIIPAYLQNIHKVVAPFVIINAAKNTVKVKFATKTTRDRVLFTGKALPVHVPASKVRKQSNKATAEIVMQQSTIRKYAKRLSKVSKLMKLALLTQNLPPEE